MLIHKTSMRFVIYSICIFLNSAPIFGMDDIDIVLNRVLHKKHSDIEYAHRSFSDGLLEYKKGNKQLAKIILDASDIYAKQHNILGHINPLLLENAYSVLCKMHHDQKNFDKALEFATSTTDKGIIYRHMAKKASEEGNRDLEKEYYAQAFNLFGQAYHYDQKAEKHYENALWLGLGYEGDRPSIIREHFLSKLQSSHIALTDEYYLSINKELVGVKKREYRKGLQGLQRLAQDDVTTQVLLAHLYLDGYLVDQSYDKSLELCQKAISNFATITPQKNICPTEYLGISGIIAQLSKAPTPQNIKNQAIVLGNYFDILSAIKTIHEPKIKRLGSEYAKKTDLQSAVFQLLCSNIPNETIQLINNITFDDPAFIKLVNDDGITPHILRCNMPQDPCIKDLSHKIIGGYEYHNKNYKAAIEEFKQFSTDDLYLKTLAIQMDSNQASRAEKLVLILPLLRNSLDSRTKNKKDTAAQKIIAEICGYNSSASVEETLSFCQEWVPHFAISDSSKNPLEYIHVLMGLNDLRKKAYLLSVHQHTIATQWITYFDFFSFLHNNDQKKLDIFFSKKNKDLTGIRRTVLQAIRGNKKNDIQNIIFENDFFKDFCISDLSLIELIKYIAQNPQDQFKITPAQAYYLLSGYFHTTKEYDLARDCLLLCNQSDLYVQAKQLEITPLQNMLEILNRCIPLLNNAQENDKNTQAKKIITQVILAQHKEYRDILIHNKQYEQAYQFAHCLTQLGQVIPSQVICNVFSILETSIIQEPHNTYRKLLEIPDRLNTYNIIKSMADRKDPAACDCISFVLYEHSNHSHFDVPAKLALARECLNYLSYSIKDDNRTNGSQKTKQSLYAQLAYQFGVCDQSIPLLDEAIKYGNTQALYEKANILSKNKLINPHDLPLIIKLLEQHAISNDDDTRRARSLSSLGKHYRTFKDVEHQKKAFDCLKAAAHLGNYTAGHLLALFYIDGIENYQAPDTEQAFTCLQKTIELKKKSSYEDALYLRASMYYIENQYASAQEDLVPLLVYPGYNQSQKLFAYWLMGLTQLSLNETMDLSQDLVSNFRIAYETAAGHKLQNADSALMQDFKLLNDKKALDIIQKNIDYIIENNKTDAPSLDFCTIMGAVLFEQCSGQPITDPYRQYAVKSLQFAAENGHIEAPFSLLYTPEEEVGFCDKIYYLKKLLLNNQSLSETIQDILTNLYPADVVSQGLLIECLHQKNNPALLEKYTSQLYEYRKPIAADPIGYSLFSHKKTEELIQKCLSIPFIKTCVEAFMKNPTKCTPQEHFITIWWASLLTYSLNEKLLLEGAAYLEKSRELFPIFSQTHIAQNLGCIYYKLGWQKYKTKDLGSAMAYLKKGCLLENAHCNDLFQTITSEQINLNTTIKKAFAASTREINMIHEIQTKFGSSKHSTHLICGETDTPENEIKLYEEVQNLVKNMSNKDYFIASENPLLCFNYAFDNYSNTQNNIKVQKAIQKAVATSIDGNGMFIVKIVLEKLCTFIKSIIEKNNRQQMELLLTTIKRELLQRKVDIKVFEGLYKDIYKVNLAQNVMWKKVK